MAHPVTYEHPLNERVRNLLRLEFLFSQAEHCHSGDTSWDSRLFVSVLMEILAVLMRSDLKTELIKELERHQISLARLSNRSEVDSRRLGDLLKRLDRLRSAIHGLNGSLGFVLRDNEFLTSIRQRSAIPGGTCAFDLPAYHQWLNRPKEERKSTQEGWMESLALARQGVELLLKLIRNSAAPLPEIATAGGYNRILEPDASFQMLRVTLDPEIPYFPEISGVKHRFTIRFMERLNDGRPQQTGLDVPFRLACCAL